MKRKIMLIALCALAVGSAFGQTVIKKKRPVKKVAPVTVVTNVDTAAVYIDGDFLPGGSGDVEYGTHVVKVEAEGFTTKEQTVSVSGPLTVKIMLEPAVAQLTVIARPRNAFIAVDGAPMKSNPMTVNFGTHTITAKAPGYQAFEQTVVVNGPITVEANLNPALFRVEVKVDVPGAMISLGDYTADRGVVSVPGGRYRLKVSARGFGDYIEDIDVNGDMVVPVRMRRAMSTLIIEPPDVYINKNMKGNHFGAMELWIDGVKVNLNRDRIDVPSGSHKLLFVTGGLWATANVELEPGATYSIEPEFVLNVKETRGRRDDRDDRDRRDRDDRDRRNDR